MTDILNELMYYINQNFQNPILDQIAPVIYTIADVRVTITLLVLVFIASWKLKKENILKITTLCIIAFFIASIFIGLSKNLYPSPRPFMVMEGIRLAVNDNGFYSFPSGHFSITVTVLSIIIMKVKKHRKVLLVPAILYILFLAFIVMYGGVHYPTDVIGGGIIGLTSAVVTVRYLDFLADRIINIANNPRESLKSFFRKTKLKK